MTDKLRAMYENLAQQVNDRSRQLVRSERLAGVGFLAAGVAHEINNPLSFVSSSIDLISTSITEVKEVLDRNLRQNGGNGAALTALRDDLDYDYRIRMLEENAAICREGAERAARIVGDLRTFCRPGNGLPMDSKVLRPMTMGLPSVSCLKRLRSSGRCQRSALPRPLTQLSAAATMRVTRGCPLTRSHPANGGGTSR